MLLKSPLPTDNMKAIQKFDDYTVVAISQDDGEHLLVIGAQELDLSTIPRGYIGISILTPSELPVEEAEAFTLNTTSAYYSVCILQNVNGYNPFYLFSTYQTAVEFQTFLLAFKSQHLLKEQV